MTPQMHALVGSGVLLVSLVVGIWALVAARRGALPSAALTVGVGVALAVLVLQLLAGADLWARGARPIEGPLAFVHAGGPFVALAGAAFHVFGRPKNRVRNYATVMLVVFTIGLLSYTIGELGNRPVG